MDKKGKIKLKDSDKIDEDSARAIASIEEVITKHGDAQLRIRFHDKKGALDTLARHLGMLTDRKEVDLKGGFVVETVNYDEEEDA